MAKCEVNSSNNVETIKELLLDEQKLVTYVSVAKDLCIHVNEAKKILTRVLEDVRKKQPTMHFNVNHLISGLSSNNSARTIICSEPELETLKGSFNTVLYHHIYSIGLGKEGVDNAALLSLNKFEDFAFCPGLIKNSLCSKRTSEDTESLKLKCHMQNTVTESKPIPVKKEKPIEKIVTKEDKNVKVKSEVISPKKETSNGLNKTNGNKSSKSIAGFFTKSNSAPSTKPNKTEESPKQSSKPDKNGLSSFLTKSNSAPNTKPNKTVKNDVKESIKIVKEIKDEEMEVDVEEIAETSKKSNKREPDSSKKEKSKSLSQIKKNAKVDKKRKRVLQVSDSDSDNDPFSNEKPNNDAESEDEIPPTPASNTVKITSGILNPKKRRKIVDKTYTDEEGYILTRKEEIYESCSDDDVVPETTTVKVEKENVQEANKVKTEVSPKDKKANKVSKKKISPPQKGKQATMMNFFKKI